MSRQKKESVDVNTPKNSLNDPSSEQDFPDEYLIRKCKIIGANIRYERKLRKFSIEDLAEYLELSSSYVGLLERGERCPSLKSLLKICELFGSSPNDFLLEKKATSSKLHVAEEKKSGQSNKYRTVLSIMQKLSESELDFIISTAKNLKTMSKSYEATNSKSGESK